MLGGLLGSKFSAKCKQGVKCIRARLVPIRNRKQSMVRILKKDVADLIAAGRDRDAFRRMDALIVEINHTACYDMIEKFCEFLLSQLSSMPKQSGELSQEVTEAMATLIFAAARFADLPELCDLRRLFTQRYGSDMQAFVNAEFVDKMQKKTFPKEGKLHLMQNIADEFSVKWDTKSYNNDLSSSPAHKLVDQQKGTVPSNISDNQPPAASCESKEITSREEFQYTAADASRQQHTLIPNDAHVISAAKNNHFYDPKMRTRKVAAYESVTVDIFEKDDPGPHDVNSRSNYIKKLEDDELKSGIRPSRKSNAQDEKEYCIDLEVQGVGTPRSLNDEPANLVPPYTKSSGNKTGYNNRIQGTALPPYSKVDGPPRNGHPVMMKSQSNLENNRQDSVEEGGLVPAGQDWKPVPSPKKGLLANMNPPYVKPRNKDPPILNCDSVDHVRSNETGARCSNGNDDDVDDHGRPRPFSVRRNFRSPPTTGTDDNAINVEKPNRDASSDGRPRNRSNRRTTSGHGNVENYEEDKAISKASKSPIGGQAADVVDYERRHGSKSSAAMHDRMENDENSYGRHSTRPSGGGGGRNRRSKQGNDEACDGNYKEERINTGSKGRKQPTEGELDDAVDYGNTPHRASRGQREHRSSRHPAAVHHDELEYDEEEMAMDMLLTHLSRKGTSKARVKDRRTRIVPGGSHAADGGSTEHQDEVIHAGKRDSANPPGRSLSMQPEPVSMTGSKPPPARAASMLSDLPSPSYGRVHQRMPDYDQLVARFAASRHS